MTQQHLCFSVEQMRHRLAQPLPAEQEETLARQIEECPTCAEAMDTALATDPLTMSLRGMPVPTTKPSPADALIERLKGLARLPLADAPQGGEQTPAPGGDFPTDADRTAPAMGGPPVDEEVCSMLAPPSQAGALGQLGPYHVLQVLGRGGMGVVFRAVDPHLERHVALKAMLPGVAANPSARTRFLREAKAAAAVKHDHVVTIHQVGEDRGVPFLAMEFLEGEPLDGRLEREGKLPVPEVLRIGREMAEGLEAAHNRGLIHRDIKPANVWLEGERGRVKILDFGLARGGADQSNLTQTGAIVGTPAYMAPEQARGETVDARCDLFSLGCVLYRLATGHAPFRGNDAVSTLLAVALEEPPPPAQRNPAVPPALSNLITRLLSKNPAGRPGSAAEVAASLTALERTTETPAVVQQKRPRRRLAWAAVAAGLLVAAAAFALLRVETPEGEFLVETADEDVAVAVDKLGGLKLTDTKTGRIFRVQARQAKSLPAGEYELMVTDAEAGLEFNTRKFSVRKAGEPARLTVSFKPKKPDERQAAGFATSPLDALRREDIPPHELAAAGGGDAKRVPGQLVAVLGDSRLRPWFINTQLWFSDDGKQLLAGHNWWPNWMEAWDAENGHFLGRLPRTITSPAGKYRTALSPDCLRISIQDARSKKTLFERQMRSIWAFNEDDSRFAWYSVAEKAKPSIDVIDPATGDVKATITGMPENSITSLAWQPSGHLLAAAYSNGSVKVYDSRTGKQVDELGGTGLTRCEQVAFSPSGKLLAGAGVGSGVRLWDTATWKPAKGDPFPVPVRSNGVAFSADGRLLVGGGDCSGELFVHDLEIGKELYRLRGLPLVFGICVSRQERLACLGVWQKPNTLMVPRIYLWDLKTGKPLINTDPSDAAYPLLTLLHPDGQHLIQGPNPFSGSGWGVPPRPKTPEGSVKVLDVRTGKLATHAWGDGPCPVAFSADGSRVLARERGNKGYRVYRTPPLSHPLDELLADLGSAKEPVALSPDGKYFACCGAIAGRIRLQEIGAASLALNIGEQSPAVMAFDPESKWLAVGGPPAKEGGSPVSLWDFRTGQKVRELAGLKQGVTSLAFGPHGQWLFGAGAKERELRVWDTATGRVL